MSIDLAVWHEGMPVHPDDHVEEKLRGMPAEGRWVIATDNDGSFLLADPETSRFYWKPNEDCVVFRMKTPDVPGLVLLVQPGTPNQQNGLVIAAPNRNMRRHMEN